MKNTIPVIAYSLLSAAAMAADNAPTSTQGIDTYPKNFARHHLATNLFEYKAANQAFVPTEAAASWLDNDVATGWPASTGHSYYLLSLASPEVLTNFALSARNTAGTISLYAGDEAAAPGAKSWTPLAKDISVAEINDKLLAHPFSHYGKYVLIELNLTEAGPLYSLYLYGEKPASSYSLLKRPQTADMRSVLGNYVNAQTSIDLAGLYSQGRVLSSTPAEPFGTLQQAVDDNPQTSVAISPTTGNSGLGLKFNGTQNVQRASALADAGTKGRLEIFAIPSDEAAQVTYQKASTAAVVPSESSPIALSGKTPVATITFDGSSPRGSVDFTATSAGQLAVRWVPATAGAPLNLHEINVFGDLTLNDYQITRPQAVAQNTTSDSSKEQGDSDGKDYKDVSGPKDTLPPVAEGPAQKSPFTPGGLGNKPIVPVLPPDRVVSP